MKPIIVGQAPSRSHRPGARAFEGTGSGTRLARLLGMTLEEFLDAFDTVNLLRRWPGKHGGAYAYREKGDRFPIAAAKRAAKRLAPSLRSRRVILAGRGVAKAFGFGGAPFLTMWLHDDPRFLALVIPHPSGCNQWWNDPANRMAAECALKVELEICRPRSAA